MAFVPPDRLVGWIRRFEASHGTLTRAVTDAGLLLAADDGATALLQPPWDADGRPGSGNDDVERLASIAAQPRSTGIILLRRGGYAVGVARDGGLVQSKVGTRYVQSRTAAGGWSQQRFARRRANQADALVEAVADHAERVIGAHNVEYLVLGGDKALCEELLVLKAMKNLARLPRLRFLDVVDPKLNVLTKAAADVRSVRITVTDP
jgi:hypothetical protein